MHHDQKKAAMQPNVEEACIYLSVPVSYSPLSISEGNSMVRRRSFSSLSLDTLASTMPLITQGKAFMGWISICSREMAADEKQKHQTKI